jgi:hypothetical protein
MVRRHHPVVEIVVLPAVCFAVVVQIFLWSCKCGAVISTKNLDDGAYQSTKQRLLEPAPNGRLESVNLWVAFFKSAK